MLTWTERIIFLLVVGAVVYGIFIAFSEQPTSVDLAKVSSGPFQVTIREEGTTQVRDVYTLSSPISGQLDRLELDEGDAVYAGKTAIASIRPLEPPFLNQRSQLELQSALKAAQSAVALAFVERERTRVALRLAQSAYDRAVTLSQKNILPKSQMEEAYNALQLQKAQVDSAKAAIDLRRAELESVRARMQQPGADAIVQVGTDCCVKISAPVDGVVLNILARSEQPVIPGTRIAEIGDPENLEVVVDLLSSDAVHIIPGMQVRLSDWGGEKEVQGRVRQVEPAAFTKVSSLGIEEQRVNIIIDPQDPPSELGHGYRIMANLVIWEGEDIVQIPIGALFRSDGGWAVFGVEDQRAVLRPLDIGNINDEAAQVLSGLKVGDEVVLYPNDSLQDGGLISPR
ncbi:MAG: HlyD family efflux transporter periplasmic adaptor subunit [Rhizobiaceae bacterium]